LSGLPHCGKLLSSKVAAPALLEPGDWNVGVGRGWTYTKSDTALATHPVLVPFRRN
jgi:hypothetical protein